MSNDPLDLINLTQPKDTSAEKFKNLELHQHLSTLLDHGRLRTSRFYSNLFREYIGSGIGRPKGGKNCDSKGRKVTLALLFLNLVQHVSLYSD